MNEKEPSQPEPSPSEPEEERKIETFEDTEIGPGSKLPDKEGTYLEFGDVHFERERLKDHVDAHLIDKNGNVVKEGKLLLSRVVEYMQDHPDAELDHSNRQPVTLSKEDKEEMKARQVADNIMQRQKSDEAQVESDSELSNMVKKAVKESAAKTYPDTIDGLLQHQQKAESEQQNTEPPNEQIIEAEIVDEPHIDSNDVKDAKTLKQYQQQIRRDTAEKMRAQTQAQIEEIQNKNWPENLKKQTIEDTKRNLEQWLKKLNGD